MVGAFWITRGAHCRPRPRVWPGIRQNLLSPKRVLIVIFPNNCWSKLCMCGWVATISPTGRSVCSEIMLSVDPLSTSINVMWLFFKDSQDKKRSILIFHISLFLLVREWEGHQPCYFDIFEGSKVPLSTLLIPAISVEHYIRSTGQGFSSTTLTHCI